MNENERRTATGMEAEPKAAEPASSRVGAGGPMLDFGDEPDLPKLELDLPAPRPVQNVVQSEAQGELQSDVRHPSLSAPLGPLELETPAARRVQSRPSHQSVPHVPLPPPMVARDYEEERPYFTEAPDTDFYTPVFFILLLVVGGGLMLLGVTRFLRVIFGHGMQVLGVRGAFTATIAGVALLSTAWKYHQSRGRGDAPAISPRMVWSLGLGLFVLMLGVHRMSKTSPSGPQSESPAGPPALYQPAFRRAFLEQLKVSFSNATVEVIAEPGQDPAASGATLRFMTDTCTQEFVDDIAQNPGTKVGLRKAGLARVACITGPEDLTGFEKNVF